MKLQLRELFNAKEAFARFLDEPLPTGVAVPLRELVKAINEHFTTLEESRNDLIREMGEEQEGGEFKFSEDTQEVFIKKFDEMLDAEVELEWETISIKDIDDAKISVKDLNTIDFLFTEFADKKEPVAV